MKVGLLLAAGLSERFGPRNKLLEPLKGQPLISHAAAVLRALALDHLIAVNADREIDARLEGFEITPNPQPERGQGRSLAIGAEAAIHRGAERVLVLLADMPFITRQHCQVVIDRCSDSTPSASALEGRAMPPACFPRAVLPVLAQRTGPIGARDLINRLPVSSLVPGDRHMLADIDTADDFQSYKD
ncbi:MAG: nucleotidyltransferase family protein [Pseudomonadota bacterium]